MATGTASLHFGTVSARKSSAFVDVATVGLEAGSYIEAFRMVEASADHGADDNRIEDIDLICEFRGETLLRIHGTVRRGRTYGTKPVRWVTA